MFSRPRYHKWEDMIDVELEIAKCEPMSPNDPNLVLSTSGSTGKPKFLVRSVISCIFSAWTLRNNYNIKPDDVVCSLTRFGFSLYY
jgi:acyl-coenzyme A synthetase/AMP-(fatty) acid ligase